MSITETASSWPQPMCYNYCALLQTGIEWSTSQMLNKYWFAHWLIPLTKILCFKIATTCHQGLLRGFKNISYLGHFILARSEGISRSLKLLPVLVWEKKEALALGFWLSIHLPALPYLLPSPVGGAMRMLGHWSPCSRLSMWPSIQSWPKRDP